jgi:hypothetical protein
MTLQHGSEVLITYNQRYIYGVVNYPYRGILIIIDPDLLYQLFKYNIDYLFDQWIYKLILGIIKMKKISQINLDIEIDTRFALIPKYPDLKYFNEGILSQKYHWIIHEIKKMMRIMIYYLNGLYPSEGFILLWEYLYLSYLIYYSIHTEESL